MIRLTCERTGAKYETPGQDDNYIEVPYDSMWHVSFVVPTSWGAHVGEVSQELDAGAIIAGEIEQGLNVVWTRLGETTPGQLPKVLEFVPREHVQQSLDWQQKSGGIGWGGGAVIGSKREDSRTLPTPADDHREIGRRAGVETMQRLPGPVAEPQRREDVDEDPHMTRR